MLANRRSFLCAAFFLAACSGKDDSAYTLYRNSRFSNSLHVRWETFETPDGGFNKRNCETAAYLLNRQAPAGLRWWCEKSAVAPARAAKAVLDIP